MTTIGVVLATIMLDGRRRLLVMRATGEIWPAVESDVTFVMPPSLIPKEVSAGCWSPQLLQLWATGQDVGMASASEQSDLLGRKEAEAMADCRRQASAFLRKVQRETERMERHLLAYGVGGAEGIWERYADDVERRTVSAHEVAMTLLNLKRPIGKNTLPTFAAHCLLMRKPECFVADERGVWASGRYLVRSRRERELRQRVRDRVFSDAPEMRAFAKHAEEVRASLAADQPAMEWEDADREFLHVLTLPMVETRSTQALPAGPVANSTLKSLGPTFREAGKKEQDTIDQADYVATLESVGMIPASDSLRASIVRESAERAAAIDGIQLPVNPAGRDEPTESDRLLDGLREDMSSPAFVIDDAGAKELDDGIALERVGDDYWIHVHVADPTRFLARGDALATQAAYMGSTLYLPEGTVPLLPHEMGKGAMSLGSGDGKGQPTLVMSALVTADGDVKDTRVRLGWLRTPRIMTYSAVNEVLGVQPPERRYPFGRNPALSGSEERDVAPLSESDAADLRTLQSLASKLRAKRTASAGLEWDQPYSTFFVRSAPPLTNIFNPASIPSQPTAPQPFEYEYAVDQLGMSLPSAQMTVAELMILANGIAAQFLSDRGVHALFRGSLPPRVTSRSRSTVEDLLAKRLPGTAVLPPGEVEKAALLWSQATVTPEAREAWLMGLPAYLRATSPLRRYDDLLAHWQIKGALAADAGIADASLKPLEKKEVERELFRATHADRRAKRSNQDAVDYWRALAVRDELRDPALMDNERGRVDLTKPITVRVRDGGGMTHAAAFSPDLGGGVSVETDHALPIGEEVQVKISGGLTWPKAVVTAKLA